jgi:signal transduction histidine kinase/ActR/RegA family two-component response regulator
MNREPGVPRSRTEPERAGPGLDASTASALQRELGHERIRGVRRINLLRFWGVSAFFALFLVLGGLLRLPAWMGNLELFAVYWLITAGVFWASRRFARFAPFTCLTIALVDTPMVFFLQWSTFPTSPSVSGVAGFTVGVYVLFVILAALSLETRYIWLTAAIGAIFEILLQHLADVSVGAMISTVILLGLTTIGCTYARDRLVALVGRVEIETQLEGARQRTEDRLRETTGLLDVAQTLGGVTEVQEALRRICRELARFTGADTVAAYLVDRDRGELRPTAGYRVPSELLEDLGRIRIRLADLSFTAALEKGELIWSDNVPDDPRFGGWRDHYPHRSALVIPSIVGGQVSGAFYLTWLENRHAFDRAELTLAQAIGQQVGKFIQNAQLYEELEKSRQRSVQVERLRAVGELAAGVAHDFNNVLAIILGRVELLMATTSLPAVRGPLSVVAQAAMDGARTVRRIEEFTRQTPHRLRELVDLRTVAHDVIDMTRARWQAQAEAKGVRYDVSVEDGGPVPPVLGDATDLREALTNLVFNALDAMPSGGRLTVRTVVDEERVRCDVVDTGVGMSDDVRNRVFEPFFSTKTEKGSGLGLSIVYGIVTRHGGEIVVESTPGVGSTFRFWLPIVRHRPALIPDGAVAARPVRAARVLVVDDEAEVRRTLAEMLALDGHVAVVCPDGAAALRVLKTETFDLVLTDLGMPELGGWEVAQAAKDLHPERPVGLITGWGDSIDVTDATHRGIDFVLAKPFQLRELREALERVLGDPRRP